jgi:hypothetical protein
MQFRTTTDSDTRRRSARLNFRGAAQIALAPAVLAGGTSVAVAQTMTEQKPAQEQNSVEQKFKWEFLIESRDSDSHRCPARSHQTRKPNRRPAFICRSASRPLCRAWASVSIRLLATTKTSTMQTEMRQLADGAALNTRSSSGVSTMLFHVSTQ